MGAPYSPCGSWARRSTGLTEPGTGMFACSIASTAPNACLAAAMSALACGPGLAMSIRVLAVPASACSEVCTFTTSPSPTMVDATATASRASTRNCWRHSRRSSRQAHRDMARRPARRPARSRRRDEGGRGWRRQGAGHRAGPASNSDSGPSCSAVWSTIRPSRRNTTRSAQAASCASWVTTTPATPP